MKKFLEKIERANGQEVEVVKSTEINEITEDKRSSYEKGGLLRRNWCIGNSEAVARFLRRYGTAEVIEGLCIINDELCVEHMWVKYNNQYIDLTFELFEKPNISTKYYKLIRHTLKPLKPLNQFEMPTRLSFSKKTMRLLRVYYSENPKFKEEYEKMKRDLNGQK